MKRITSILMAVLLFCSISIAVNAEDGKEASEESVNHILSEYAEFREQQFFEDELAEPCGIGLSESVFADAVKRQTCLKNSAETGGYHHTEVSSEFSILEISHDDNEIIIRCNESNIIGYAYHGNRTTDEMRLVTEHVLHILFNEGAPVITADTHDEWACNGFRSSDYVPPEEPGGFDLENIISDSP